MWKSRKDDERPAQAPAAPPTVVTPAPQPAQVRPVETSKMNDYRAEVAHIGKSVIVKGELSGNEDLYLDGEVEGSIELKGHNLTIGPNGRVRANVTAKEVVVHGKVDGNIRGVEKVELKKSAVLNGDISTQRIVIEDGAFFKGAIDIQKSDKPEAKVQSMAAAASSTSSSVSHASPTATPSYGSGSSSSASMPSYPQGSLLDRK